MSLPEGPSCGSGGHSFENIHIHNKAHLGDAHYHFPELPRALPRPSYAGHYSYSSLPPVTTFVQRPSLHDELHEQLTKERVRDDAQSSRIVVVSGLGGAGKTQLVRSYIRQHRQEYSASFWIEAGRKATTERGFLEVYRLLFDVATFGDGSVKIEDAVVAIKNWFNGREGRWLFVFDGADRINGADGDKYLDDLVNIQHFIPDSPYVNVVITTRSLTAEGLTPLQAVRVAKMEPDEAATLFKKCSKIDYKDHDEATVHKVVGELGYFALAVSLSGAYVCKTDRLKSDLREYLKEYRERRKEILAQKPIRLVHQYGESVLTTWETTFDAVVQQSIEASKLLTLLGFINFDDISIKLFLPASRVGNNQVNQVGVNCLID
ncbi:uncharacterized protein BDR25DRAFT_305314 [Lindgomyces ingoldianus]|uniref:Uncharacterized protein n=1 Tax=Lindgomyces ingoldianus TaxID=673940 RepID=A0ACB6QLK1_9PLEO|nr:uncharacterized protein BDR25DRAFT_305314 [Lindgomyces ingoldianus]KAF2467863.1 hypothetical protein BDR25DRAFT_305314 [Lindgomyces ingoldianus]